MQSLTVIEKTLLIRAMERKGGVGDMQCALCTLHTWYASWPLCFRTIRSKEANGSAIAKPFSSGNKKKSKISWDTAPIQ